jgi:hypothetical protein
MSEELSWWSNHDETLLGLIFRDVTDDDFGWMILARDRAGRFRCIDLDTSLRSAGFATVALRQRIAEYTPEKILEAAYQADEPNAPVDLLRLPVDHDPQKLHPYFRELLESPGRVPARAAVREIGPWLAPSDPHFIQEFQESQFDQRLWELFLWASFREMGFDVDQLEAPDFLCRMPGFTFSVEATTAAPSTMGPLATHPNPQTKKEMEDFLSNYMPLKYGSSLYSKLMKQDKNGLRYWERNDVGGSPFVLAIADFHRPATENEIGSMTYTQSALWMYLYGQRVSWRFDDHQLVIMPTKVEEHTYGDKKAPSGFFDLPDSENVAAVLFSNAGTIAKFDRMGVVAGFAPEDHSYLRIGLKYNPDPNAVHGIPFSADVGSEEYEEMWSDELQIFHNPNAKMPIPPDMFSGLTQHFWKDGDLYSLTPEGAILSSYTMIFRFGAPKSDVGAV